MTTEEALAAYSKLSSDVQIRVLARFAHHVTVIARDTYIPGNECVSDPRRLRYLNEVQHRVLGQLEKLLTGDPARYADADAVAIIAGSDARLLTAFSRAIREGGDSAGTAPA